mmetsp:Transcript_6281/g.9536  ORF Transcript_6281/g.9536 Transcript_6281/m.9536 type:complete len:208 (+) Transcript_6281:28-651(+)
MFNYLVLWRKILMVVVHCTVSSWIWTKSYITGVLSWVSSAPIRTSRDTLLVLCRTPVCALSCPKILQQVKQTLMAAGAKVLRQHCTCDTWRWSWRGSYLCHYCKTTCTRTCCSSCGPASQPSPTPAPLHWARSKRLSKLCLQPAPVPGQRAVAQRGPPPPAPAPVEPARSARAASGTLTPRQRGVAGGKKQRVLSLKSICKIWLVLS